MSSSPHKTLTPEKPRITCNPSVFDPLQMEYESAPLACEPLLVAQAMQLLIHLDRDLMEARGQFNQDWFRRIMRARPKAVLRLRRRWGKVYPSPQISLGNLRRRYHANLAKYLYN